MTATLEVTKVKCPHCDAIQPHGYTVEPLDNEVNLRLVDTHNIECLECEKWFGLELQLYVERYREHSHDA